MTDIPFEMEWASDEDRIAYEHDVMTFGQGYIRQNLDGLWEHQPLDDVLEKPQ